MLETAIRFARAASLRVSAAFVAATLLPTLAFAQSLYTARVEFDARAGQTRAAAYEAALQVVLFRVSGSELSSNPALIAEVFPDPSDYVIQFRPGEDDTLWVSFDGEALENTLRRSGQLVWGGDRPPTLVIMALDLGTGQRELIGATAAEVDDSQLPDVVDYDSQFRDRILAAAEARGIPVVLPLLDAEDIATFTFADVWGGFEAPVLAAARRYGVDSVLIGRLRADDMRLDRWTYFFAGEQYSWTGEPETVIGLTADRLAEEYAIGGDEPLRSVDLSISGVVSVEGYASLQVLLKKVHVIEDIRLVGVDGDRIDYSVTAYGGASRLGRALRLGGLIEEERFDVGDPSGVPRDPRFTEQLNFFYNP
ncbi:MAG: DUF2066 domain-containing protein [Woeseiaceae bacterium]|nr:DUF2066 domain-containing protein [Woeseiaceae bacterium]